MRIALIGCGRRLRQSLLPVIAEDSGREVAALVDPDRSAAARALESLRLHRARPPASPLIVAEHRALARDRVDAVVLASPHRCHFEQAREWSLRGLPVFAEKPLACSAADATELAQRCGTTGLAVSDPRRHRPDLTEVTRLARSGVIGRLQRVVYDDFIRIAPDFAGSWRDDPHLAGGGVLLDLGCHALAALLRLCAPRSRPARVVDASLHRGPHRVETGARLRVRLDSIDAEVALGLTPPGGPCHERIELVGSTGTIRLHRERARSGLAHIHVAAVDRSDSYSVRIGDEFDGECLRRFLREPHADVDLDDHVTALRLIDDAYSLAERRRELAPAGRRPTRRGVAS